MKAHELAEIMSLRLRLQRLELQAERYGRSDERTVETSREVDEIVVEQQRGLAS